MEAHVLWVSSAASSSSLKPAGSLLFSFPAAHPTFSPGPQAKQCFCALALLNAVKFLISLIFDGKELPRSVYMGKQSLSKPSMKCPVLPGLDSL